MRVCINGLFSLSFVARLCINWLHSSLCQKCCLSGTLFFLSVGYSHFLFFHSMHCGTVPFVFGPTTFEIFFVLTPSRVALTSHTEISFMQSILYSSASGASHLVLSVQRVGHFNCCLSTLPSKEPSATSIADWHSTRWNDWAFLWAMATPVMLILLF